MRTLVTRGAGFIGTHLVRALCQRGDDVVVLDSLAQQVHGAMAPDERARILGAVRDPQRRHVEDGVDALRELGDLRAVPECRRDEA